ncbi:hypothetical protein [Fortiea contorta]|uniref:hypothetical protein n=1 Tax=Fortiea contorta TaxID=1892405 RepID=UPI000377A5D9|nr:hypothetical protein [Fortiea contorta]
MNLLSHYAGVFLRVSFCLTAFISFATFKLTPALAQTATVPAIPTLTVQQGGFSGVITYITPSTYVSSIAAEKVSPAGTYLAGIDGNGTYAVQGSAYIDPVTHVSVPSIILFGGPTLPLPAAAANPVGIAVGDRLVNGNLSLDQYTAILRSTTRGLF